MSVPLTTTKDRARGHWRVILPAIGIDDSLLSGRNCPCPICGGVDRFRFIDRQDRDGMWVCSQCTPNARPAIDLVVKFTGKPFKEAAALIDSILGSGVTVPNTAMKPRADNGSGAADRLWRQGLPVAAGDVVDRYLHHRGVGLDSYPPILRTALVWDYDDGVRSQHPTMLARVDDAAGNPIAVHRTFLAPDGSDKADMDSPRKVAGRIGRSASIRLAPVAPVMGIAEGIETALAAEIMFQIPIWSVISTHGVTTFEPPEECERLLVFADNDEHGAGERAAQAVADRLLGRVDVEIRLPQLKDWNDELKKGGR
jgi:putative DNA primase/helicase